MPAFSALSAEEVLASMYGRAKSHEVIPCSMQEIVREERNMWYNKYMNTRKE